MNLHSVHNPIGALGTREDFVLCEPTFEQVRNCQRFGVTVTAGSDITWCGFTPVSGDSR